MWWLRLFLVVLIGAGVLATGTLPPDHLHHSTAAHPQVVHSQLGLLSIAAALEPHGCLGLGDDLNESAVNLNRVMARGPRAATGSQPAILSTSPSLPPLALLEASPGRTEPDATPSPPRRPIAPRAPPSPPRRPIAPRAPPSPPRRPIAPRAPPA